MANPLSRRTQNEMEAIDILIKIKNGCGVY